MLAGMSQPTPNRLQLETWPPLTEPRTHGGAEGAFGRQPTAPGTLSSSDPRCPWPGLPASSPVQCERCQRCLSTNSALLRGQVPHGTIVYLFTRPSLPHGLGTACTPPPWCRQRGPNAGCVHARMAARMERPPV